MTKYGVEFTIEADSLGHATNRALVALYKGDLDAEDVRVYPRDGGDKYRTYGEETEEEVVIRTVAPKPTKIVDGGIIPPNPAQWGKYAEGGHVQVAKMPEPENGSFYTKEEVQAIGQPAIKKLIQEGRKKIPKEPGLNGPKSDDGPNGPVVN